MYIYDYLFFNFRGTLVRKAGPGGKNSSSVEGGEEIVDERLKNIEPKMIELITNEVRVTE